MPKVEQYGLQKIETNITKGARAQSLPASNLGQLGEGVSALGKGVGIMQERIATTEAEEAAVQFERAKNDMFFNPDTGYFKTQGRTAYDSAEDATNSLGELKKQFSEGLTNQHSKRLFDRVAEQHVTRGNASISQHATKGLDAWEVATMKASVENTIENAVVSWNDPDGLREQESIGEQTILDIGAKQGLDGEALNESLETYRSSFASAAISAATANNAAAGEELLDKLDNRLEGPDRLKLQAELVKKQKAEKTKSDATTAINNASSIKRANATRQEALDAAEEIADPELRKSTRQEITRLYNQEAKAEKERKADAWESAQQTVFDDNVSVEAFISVAPEQWDDLTRTQKDKLRAGKKTVTNQAVFNRILAMSPSDQASLDWTKYTNDLSPADLGKVRTTIDGAKSGKHNTFLRSKHQTMQRAAETLFGKKEGKKVDEFYEAMQDAVFAAEESKKAKLTQSELATLVNSTTSKFVLENNFLMFDKTLTARNTPVAELMAMNTVATTLGGSSAVKKQIATIRKGLIEHDIPITAETILRAYNSGL